MKAGKDDRSSVVAMEDKKQLTKSYRSALEHSNKRRACGSETVGFGCEESGQLHRLPPSSLFLRNYVRETERETASIVNQHRTPSEPSSQSRRYSMLSRIHFSRFRFMFPLRIPGPEEPDSDSIRQSNV